MPVTTQAPDVYVLGLGAANITYANGAATTTAYAVTGGEVEPFADQEKISVNGSITAYMAKNHGTRYNFTAYIKYTSAPVVALVPPAINSRIDFEFYEAATPDVKGIVTASKIAILDGVAVLTVTIEVASGVTPT